MKGKTIALIGNTPFAKYILSQWKHEIVTWVCLPEEEGECPIKKDVSSEIEFKRAKLHTKDVIITSILDHEKTIQIAKIAKKEGIRHFIAILNDEKGIKEINELGFKTLIGGELILSWIKSELYGSFSSIYKNIFKDEHFYELVVEPGALAVGKSLKELHARNWRILGIYRDNKFILPTGKAKINNGDKILLAGEEDIISHIIEFFKVGPPQFPLQYGSGVLLIVDKPDMKLIEETFYLLSLINTHRINIYIVKENARYIEKLLKEKCIDLAFECYFNKEHEFSKNIESLNNRKDFGLIVYVNKTQYTKKLRYILKTFNIPIYIPRGTFPFDSILLPVNNPQRVMYELSIAVDIERICKSKLSTISVLPSEVLVGEDTVPQEKTAILRVKEITEAYGIPIEIIELQGNPVKRILETSKDFQLMILSHTPNKLDIPIFSFDVSRYIIKHTPVSLIVMPVENKKYEN